MFFWRILRTLGSLIGVSGGKALFQFLPSWDQFPTAALSSEVLNYQSILPAYCIVLGPGIGPEDGGIYSCLPGLLPPTNITVHVLKGITKQQYQHGKKNKTSAAPKKTSSPLRQKDKKTKPQNTNTTKKQKETEKQLHTNKEKQPRRGAVPIVRVQLGVGRSRPSLHLLGSSSQVEFHIFLHISRNINCVSP